MTKQADALARGRGASTIGSMARGSVSADQLAGCPWRRDRAHKHGSSLALASGIFLDPFLESFLAYALHDSLCINAAPYGQVCFADILCMT